MKLFARIVAVIVGLLPAATLTQTAHASLLDRPGERRDDNAIKITNDSGGYVEAYASRLSQLRSSRQKIKFAGRCDSACTLLLALPSNQTCLTRDAYFRFHAPSAPSEHVAHLVEGWMMKVYPNWVRAWMQSRGGWSIELVTMDYAYASKFIRACPEEARL